MTPLALQRLPGHLSNLRMRMQDRGHAVAPGLLLVAVIAMAARFIADQYGGPVMLYALLFGVAFNFLAAEDKTAPGIEFSAKTLLRLGVALLGARLTLGDIAALGWANVALVWSAVAAAILGGWGIGRLFRLKHDHAVLSAGAVAICGVSAAMAIAAVLPATRERGQNLSLTVAGVAALSTMAMIFYPIVAQLLAFDERVAGIFLGATIHDVAQVVGAGHMISDTAGESATLVKLVRMAMLVPVVIAISWVFRDARAGDMRGSSPLPWFLLAYIRLVLLNSAGAIPPLFGPLLLGASSWCIVAAVAALGVRTSVRDLVHLGPRPMAAMLVQTAFLALFVAAGLLLLGPNGHSG